jgi:hypothetical protein
MPFPTPPELGPDDHSMLPAVRQGVNGLSVCSVGRFFRHATLDTP